MYGWRAADESGMQKGCEVNKQGLGLAQTHSQELLRLGEEVPKPQKF